MLKKYSHIYAFLEEPFTVSYIVVYQNVKKALLAEFLLSTLDSWKRGGVITLDTSSKIC